MAFNRLKSLAQKFFISARPMQIPGSITNLKHKKIINGKYFLSQNHKNFSLLSHWFLNWIHYLPKCKNGGPIILFKVKQNNSKYICPLIQNMWDEGQKNSNNYQCCHVYDFLMNSLAKNWMIYNVLENMTLAI